VGGPSDPPDVPGPLRIPDDERVGAERIYGALRRSALSAGTEFWAREARARVRWMRPFTRTLDWEPPFARWFPDGELNASDNCLDRHVGHDAEERVAYHWEGEPGDRRSVTFGALLREVESVAAGLRDRGFGPSDCAAIYLPMVPELPVAMLALARLGIPFSVIFSGFSAAALRERILDIGARLVFTADGGHRRGRILPLKSTVDEALAGDATPRTVVVVRRTGESVPSVEHRDVEYADLLRTGGPPCPPTPLASTHPLFSLYSSGTTGRPKGISHGTGGYLTHVISTMRWVFDPRPDDVFWCAADIGWVTGHSYVVFAPLALGTTGVLYEGAFDHPSPERFWEIAERYRVSILHTSPTALRSLRKNVPDPRRGHDLGALRLLGTVGEAINPAVWRWYFDAVGDGRCPIVDTWWQTETGGMMVSPAPGIALIPLKPGSATLPLPGIDVDVVSASGEPAPPGSKGFVVVRRPWPGMLLTLRGDDDRYRSTYWGRFPGLYYTGDFGIRDEDGYLWFLGRADEVLKVSGHRLGTIEIEHALLSHPGVAEAAVCGRADATRGEVPVAFVVLKPGLGSSAPSGGALRDRVGEEIGHIARPEEVVFVRSLPKTRSGKIMRRVVRAVAEGREDLGDVSTLEDGASVEEILRAVQELRRQLGGAGP
jgi:acetyl-CoA synthetase